MSAGIAVVKSRLPTIHRHSLVVIISPSPRDGTVPLALPAPFDHFLGLRHQMQFASGGTMGEAIHPWRNASDVHRTYRDTSCTRSMDRSPIHVDREMSSGRSDEMERGKGRSKGQRVLPTIAHMQDKCGYEHESWDCESAAWMIVAVGLIGLFVSSRISSGGCGAVGGALIVFGVGWLWSCGWQEGEGCGRGRVGGRGNPYMHWSLERGSRLTPADMWPNVPEGK